MILQIDYIYDYIFDYIYFRWKNGCEKCFISLRKEEPLLDFGLQRRSKTCVANK